MQYTVHPAAEVFPMIGEKELAELAQDIRKNGLMEAIKIQNGQIIDGRNRLKACEVAGVRPRFEEIKTDNIITYIIGANIHRRHLTTAQRAAIAAELANMTHGGDRKSEKIKAPNGAMNGEPQISQSDAADMMGVSRRSVQRAVDTMKDDPEAHEMAKRGEKPKKKAKAKNTVQRVSWTSIAAKYDLVPQGNAGLSKSKRHRIKQQLIEIDPAIVIEASGADPVMAARIERACAELQLREQPQSIARKAENTAKASRADLSQTAEQKLQTAIRAHKRKLDAEYEMRIQERVKVELQIMLDDYNRISEKHKQVIAAYKGVFSRAEYKSLLGILHPDSLYGIDDLTRAKVERAFNLIKSKEFELCGDDGSISGTTLPKTLADLIAKRKGKT